MSLTTMKKSLFAKWVQWFVGFASVASVIGVAEGCSSDPATSLNHVCKLNSDCTGSLVCSFGLCHAECEELRDCPENELCVSARGEDGGTAVNVCQLQEESHCAHNSECKAPLVCAVDLQCRNQCLDTRDCISGETCVFGVCASPNEIASDGTLKHAVSGSTAPGSGAGGTRSDGGSGGSSSGGLGGNGTGGASGASGASHGGSGGTSAVSTDAGSGGGESDASIGTGGGDAGAAVSAGDPCGKPEKTPNDDRSHATPYVLGTEFEGCLQTSTDVDFYSYTVPSTPAQGGVIVISLTQVGVQGSLNVTTQAVADGGDIVSANGINGQSVFQWFGAKAGASFRIKVNYFNSNPNQIPTPYTLLAKYTGVNDVNEPNDTQATATAITNGKAVQGYLFAGYENSTSIASAAWQDWFKVTFPAGTATITLMDIAGDINSDVTLYDSLGELVSERNTANAGASVVMSQSVMAGDYYVRVQPFDAPSPRGTGSILPQYTMQPYTLVTSVK
jgi:hypothetical protein